MCLRQVASHDTMTRRTGACLLMLTIDMCRGQGDHMVATSQSPCSAGGSFTVVIFAALEGTGHHMVAAVFDSLAARRKAVTSLYNVGHKAADGSILASRLLYTLMLRDVNRLEPGSHDFDASRKVTLDAISRMELLDHRVEKLFPLLLDHARQRANGSHATLVLDTPSYPCNRPYVLGQRPKLLASVRLIRKACPCCRVRVLSSQRNLSDAVIAGCVNRAFSPCDEEVNSV